MTVTPTSHPAPPDEAAALSARELRDLVAAWVAANFADAEDACLTVGFGVGRASAVIPVPVQTP